MNTVKKGKIGEDMARQFLEEKGYKFVGSNFYSRFGEIDLIMIDGDITVFCEVKMRSSLKYGSPLEAVDQRKKNRIWKTAQFYLKTKNVGKWRIDVIGILGNQNEITHVKSAF